MLQAIGTHHCPFLHTDYSLPVSLSPPRELFFLSCNDVISIDFCLFIHHSIIVKYDLNSSTIDELGEGAWKDGGASSTGAERVG